MIEPERPRMPLVETSRLQLRMFRPQDADDVYCIWSDPEVTKYIDPNWTVTRKQTRAAMNRLVKHWQQHGFGQWAMILKAEKKLIGYCGFKFLDGTPEVELLYGLAKTYWGQGLTTEAAKACLRYAFENTRLDRVVAVAMRENIGSYRVMEKSGMKYEKDAHYYDGPVVYYVITRGEYSSDSSPYSLVEK